MAGQSWLDAYPVATPGARPAPPASGRPALTPLGPPHVPQPPPQTAANAEHDQNAVELDRLRIEREQREAAAGPGAQAAQNERQAASFLLRALGSNQAYETTHVQPRSVPGQYLADHFPNIAYAAADPHRQTAEGAQNEFIAATLRQDSGAAIPPAEIETQRNIYFPRPGASAEAIAEARAARGRAIAGLLNAGGRSVTPEMRAAASRYLEALDRYNAASIPGASPPRPVDAQPPNPPEGGGPAGGIDPETGALEVTVTGGQHIPATPEAAWPALRRDFDLQRRQNPNLTWEAFTGAIRQRGEYTPSQVGQRPDGSQGAGGPSVSAAPAPQQPPSQAPAPDTLDRIVTASMSLGNLGLAIPQAIAATGLMAPGEMTDAATRGALDAPSFGFRDEIAGLTRTALGGGDRDANIARERRIDASDWQNHPISRGFGEFEGGFALPAGGTTLGRLALTGAGYSGGYGLGSGEGLTDRLIRAGEGGAAGAVAGPVLSVAGQAAAKTFRALRGLVSSGSSPVADAGGVAAADLIAAADRQGVDVMPADVGGPMTRRFTAGAAQSPFASGPVIEGSQNVQRQVGARVNEIATQAGAPLKQEAFGDRARAALENFNDTSGAYGREAYRQAGEMSHDTLLQGRSAFQNLNGQIRELRATGGTDAPLISGLERLRSDIADDSGLNSLSVDAMRRLRTSTRAEAQTEGLRGTDYQRRAGEVLTALSDDIASQLPADAAAEFRRADNLWKDRLNFIDDIESRILGPKNDRSAEGVAQRLIGMSRGDSSRFRSVLQTVNPEEAGIIRGSVISDLGRPPPSAQAGNDFSIETFLTNWNRLPERTRNTLFPGALRSDIEDLATIAEGSRQAAGYANRSNTGGAANVSEKARALSYGAAWFSLGGSAVLEHLTGRLLASPRFARWLAHPPADPGTQVRRLAQIVTREPQLAADIIPIQRVLEGGTRAAAAQDATEDPR